MAQLLARLEELAGQIDPAQWAHARVHGVESRLLGGGAQSVRSAPPPTREFQRLCGRVVPTLNDASSLGAALVPFLARAAADPSGNGNGGNRWGNQPVGQPALPPPQGGASPVPRQASPRRSGNGGGAGAGGGRQPVHLAQGSPRQGGASPQGSEQDGVHRDVWSALGSALRHALQSPRSTQ